MNNLYQDNWFDYTSANTDFYKKATSEPFNIDWTLPITMLQRFAGVSTTHLAQYLGESRDHIEGVKIGKINKPNKPESLAKLIAQYVEPERLL